MATDPTVDQRQTPRTATSNVEFNSFGGPTTIQESSPIAGTVPTEVMQNNAERVQFVLVNNSAQVVTLAWKSNVANGQGIQLQPNGGMIQMSLLLDGSTVGWSLFAVSPGGGAQLYVAQWIRYDSREG